MITRGPSLVLHPAPLGDEEKAGGGSCELPVIWTKFLQSLPAGVEKTRAEILDSWQRCLHHSDPRQEKRALTVAAAELQGLFREHEELIGVALPVMEHLYRLQAGARAVLFLSDSRGHLLKILGEAELAARLEAISFVPGAEWSEEGMGTNALGTCLHLGRPLHVASHEHWAACLRSYASTAAPIQDPHADAALGACGMISEGEAGPSAIATMSLASELIRAQIAAQRNWKRFQKIDRYKTLILESTSEALMTLDPSGLITDINQKAAELLKVRGNPLGRSIYSVLAEAFGRSENYREINALLNTQKKVEQEFAAILSESGTLRCSVSVRYLAENPATSDRVVILRDIVFHPKRNARERNGNEAVHTFADIIGQNRAFLASKQTALRASRTSSHVLLTGESGTGKDLFAQAIHNNSARAEGPFVAINCAAIPENLLGSELFGYTEGAFTGARKGGNSGKFELANQGTIFLDEIGEMPLDMQVSLLRVLEEKRITRIGGREAVPLDVRVIAATNKNLALAVAEGKFRMDLYYRLNVITIELPPLRERKDDLPLLVETLARRLGEKYHRQIQCIEPDFFRICLEHKWPGNVRELQNFLEKAISLSDEPILSLRTSGQANDAAPAASAAENENFLRETSRMVEKELIRSVVAKHKGNKSLAARELRISRSSLYRKLVA